MSDFTLRQANQSDARALFDLRNHPDVRSRSNNTDEISFDTHQAWFNKVLSDQYKQVFIAERSKKFVGMVRFEKIEDAYLMSWAISPEYQGLGLGKEVVKSAIQIMGQKAFVAEIKPDNIASIKIAEYVGMRPTKITKTTVLYRYDYR